MNEELLKKILEELEKLNKHNTKVLDEKEKSNKFLQQISASLMVISQK